MLILHIDFRSSKNIATPPPRRRQFTFSSGIDFVVSTDDSSGGSASKKTNDSGYPTLRKRKPIDIPTPAINMAHVDGSGTAPVVALTVNESAVAPEPHVYV